MLLISRVDCTPYSLYPTCTIITRPEKYIFISLPHFRMHTGRNWFNLFQISFSANTKDAHPGGVRGVKRPEILWETQKYSLPGRPSSQNGVKSKTICHFLRNFDEFLNGFWFYSILAGWSTWQWVFLNFSQNFWSFDTHDTPGCASAVIWNKLKQI